jgi:hypothetical protein
MKNLSKLIAGAAIASALFFTTNVKAQSASTPPDPWRLGIGVEAGIPTGNAHDISNFEAGGTVRLQYDVGSNFAYTLTSGFYNFFGKQIPNTDADYSSLGIVPLKAGIKAFFAPNLYFGAEAGAGFETNAGGSTKLILSPALGFANKTWDVGARYENFSGQGNSYGLVGLRVAYAFKL